MNPQFLRRSLVLAIALALVGAGLARADDDRREDHEDARRALEGGEVRPLAEIRGLVAGRIGGRVVGVELEHSGGRYVYEFKVIAPDGRLLEIYVDARTGATLRSEAD